MTTYHPMRHPVTGRFMAGDCERDCLEHCAGPCGAFGCRCGDDEETHWRGEARCQADDELADARRLARSAATRHRTEQ
jgi:hypothetical protein